MPLSVHDRNLKAFEWLPREQWTPDRIIGPNQYNGKGYCKICDGWISPQDQEEHCKKHVAEYNALHERLKQEAADERERIENEQRAIAGLPPKQHKQRKTNNRKGGSMDDSTKQEIVEVLKGSNGMTLAALSERFDNIPTHTLRATLNSLPNVGIIDHVKTGQRGRPAAIFGVTL